MFTELRHWLRDELPHQITARRVMAAAAILCGVVLLLPLMPTYGPVRGGMEQQFLEARGRSRQQVAQREADTRRAAEQAAQQEARAREEEARQRAAREREAEQRRAQEGEQRAKEREHGLALAEFRRIARNRQTPFGPMLENIGGAQRELQKRAGDPRFYVGNIITPEETSSPRPCADPATTMEQWNRDARRIKNIYACAVHLSGVVPRTDAERRARNVTIALLQRVNFDDAAGYYPFHTLIAYVWIDVIAARLRQGEMPPRLPELMDGEQFNPALFANVLSQGFARRMIETATPEEKLALGRNIYPDLKQLSELAPRIVSACKTLGRTDCLSDE